MANSIPKKYDSSTLTQRAFCHQNDIALSTFLAKKRLLSGSPVSENHQNAFIRGEIIEQNTHQPIFKSLSSRHDAKNRIELSIPQSISAAYLAELIEVLSS